MVSIKVWLTGRQSDLAALEHHFTSEPTIRCDETEKYYLTASSFEALSANPNHLRAEAATRLALCNGIARLLVSGFQPVQLSGPYSVEGKGNFAVLNTAVESATAFAIGVVSDNGVPLEPPPPPAPKLISVAGRSPAADEAYRLMGSTKELNWSTLYKVFEIVKKEVGTERKLIRKNWTSKSEISAFTGSANSARVSGDEARHAEFVSGTPTNTMTLTEARAFIIELVRAWSDSLAES